MVKPNAIVVTSINPPNRALRMLARGAQTHGMRFFVIGDTKSPADFQLEGCEFVGVEQQIASGSQYAAMCPLRHYARKNIGYLLAARAGAAVILDTDDDNLPRHGFWSPRLRRSTAALCSASGWINIYRYFSEVLLWPRGLPLEAIKSPLAEFETLSVASFDCPIQQGLADGDPDVDAIYRLLLPLPQRFRQDRRVALAPQTWCPFNSQNTAWFRDAFPLLYLPAYCSFRMTDIWRSFVAQRIGWENGWSLLFHEATVWQERNEHNLMLDFADEVPGYLHNTRIADTLQSLTLQPGISSVGSNLRTCYEALVSLGVIGANELPLLDAWLGECAEFPTT